MKSKLLPLLSQPVFSPPVNYMQAVLALAPFAFWPLSEAGGTTAYDRSGNAYNGAYTGVALAEPGLFNKTCPYFDGGAASCNIYSAGMAGAFNGQEGTLAIWAKVYDSAVWSDSTNRYPIMLYVNADNTFYLRKPTLANLIYVFYRAGAVTKQVNISTSTTGWAHYAMTWSKTADQMIAYFNGAQSGSTQTGLGTWAGALTSGSQLLGSAWNGWLQYTALWDRPLSPAEIASLYL
jgi:hypothetical protein